MEMVPTQYWNLIKSITVVFQKTEILFLGSIWMIFTYEARKLIFNGH